MTQSAPKHDLLIYVGAGEGRALLPVLAGAKRAVLIDADGDATVRLQERFGDDARVEIYEAALGLKGEDAPFFQFNMRKYNGFHSVDALGQIYPGLSVAGQLGLAKQDAAEFIASIRRPSDVDIALVIDANGDEAEILDSLQAAKCIREISSISIHCGNEPLYRHSMTAKAAAARLDELGFEPARIVGAGHLRTVHATHSQGSEQNEELVAELKAKLADSETALEQSARSEAQLKMALDGAKAELSTVKSQLEQTRSHLQSVQTERERQVREAQGASDILRKRIAELSERNTALEAEATERQARIRALQEGAKGFEARQADLEKRAGDTEGQAEALKSELKASQQEIESARSDLAVALRRQDIAASDLRELQEQYKELRSVKQHQDDLLFRLRNRLSEAADYLAIESSSDEDSRHLES